MGQAGAFGADSRTPLKKNMGVGIKEIDSQHKGLLELINRLSRMDPNRVDRQKIFAALNALVDYAQTHFDTEERYLKTYEFPGLAQQQREHIAFTADVFKLAQRLESNDPRVHAEIMDLTKNWYISHVLGTDREYMEFLISKGVK
jgi:hemerythrin-like metal-binding protein